MQVTLELRALLKVCAEGASRTPGNAYWYPTVQAYMGCWRCTSTMPKELDFPSSTTGKWEDEPDEPVDLDAMHCTESALGKVSLPPKACFVPGKVVHV